MTAVIASNQIKCLKCGASVHSARHHEFVSCPCGAVSVDGGGLYLRRAGNPDDWEEQSILLDSELLAQLKSAVTQAQRTGRNPVGVVFAVLRALRDAGYADLIQALHEPPTT